MLTTAHQAALEATTDKVYLSLAPTMDASDAGALNDLAREILNHVRLSLAVHLRKRNQDALDLKHRLPVEIWESIWIQLSTKERIYVSHVSSDWRSNALSCPSLWSNVPYTSSGSYSLGRVQAFLERSRGVVFHLDLEIGDVADDVILKLSELIFPHHRRMATVQAVVQEPTSFQAFLSTFTSLPALRRIGLSSQQTDNVELERDDLLILPALSSLVFDGRVTCGQPFQFSCPAVSSVTAMFNTSGHVLRLLRACPSAVDWTLQVGSRPAGVVEGDLQEVHELLSAAQVRSLHVVKAYRVDVEACLKLFAPARIDFFDISCASSEGIDAPDFERHFLENDEQASFSYFDCVKQHEEPSVTKMSLTMNGGIKRRSIYLTMGDGRAECLILVSRVLAIASVTHFRITGSYWSSTFPVDGGVKRDILAENITIEFDDEDDINEWITSSAKGEPRRFVRLENLTIKAAYGTPSLVISESFIASFTRLFGADRMLHKLVLEGLILTGDVDVLLGQLAAEVQYSR
ncbi:hypothetical protein BKA62DRAFT_702524 [Auriculariales sp. MPI-PUGE-AT-0066]|nr:hypothetical protein BKA62DRAFT_702524 [Auriculariales sp. MPI-PUGE-AT-0066]